MSDIVERLRASYSLSHFLVMEAIDEIERLRAISDHAQCALAPFKSELERQERVRYYRDGDVRVVDLRVTIGELRRLCLALSSNKQQSDPADIWDAYCEEVPADQRSPQGAMAFALSVTSTERLGDGQ